MLTDKLTHESHKYFNAVMGIMINVFFYGDKGCSSIVIFSSLLDICFLHKWFIKNQKLINVFPRDIPQKSVQWKESLIYCSYERKSFDNYACALRTSYKLIISTTPHCKFLTFLVIFHFKNFAKYPVTYFFTQDLLVLCLLTLLYSIENKFIWARISYEIAMIGYFFTTIVAIYSVFNWSRRF